MNRPRTLRDLQVALSVISGFAALALIAYWARPVNRSKLGIQDCVLILMLAAFAIVPWIRWSNRFSLRTLLIATTLIAIVLGLAAWEIRS
jgi:hypothetical protein